MLLYQGHLLGGVVPFTKDEEVNDDRQRATLTHNSLERLQQQTKTAFKKCFIAC